jgi:hypothetical protein
MLRSSWVAAQLAASQEGLSSIKLVNYTIHGYISSSMYPYPALLRKCIWEICFQIDLMIEGIIVLKTLDACEITEFLGDSSEVFAAVIMKNAVAPCSPVELCRLSEDWGKSYFHLQSRRDSHNTRRLCHARFFLVLFFSAENGTLDTRRTTQKTPWPTFLTFLRVYSLLSDVRGETQAARCSYKPLFLFIMIEIN